MSNIIYDANKIKIYQDFYEICEYAEFEKDWIDALWADIVTCEAIYEELVYYIGHHTFLDRVKVEGYSLCDLYVWQMERYNLIADVGKNPRTCNKERMVMRSFRSMLDMMANPEVFRRRLEDGKGRDRL